MTKLQSSALFALAVWGACTVLVIRTSLLTPSTVVALVVATLLTGAGVGFALGVSLFTDGEDV